MGITNSNKQINADRIDCEGALKVTLILQILVIQLVQFISFAREMCCYCVFQFIEISVFCMCFIWVVCSFPSHKA